MIVPVRSSLHRQTARRTSPTPLLTLPGARAARHNPYPHGAISNPVCAVMIGWGQMMIAGRDLEIWTRLLIEVGSGWLEIFNALDENGYDFHPARPTGAFIPCIE